MKTFRFIGIQETADVNIVHPLINDDTGTTLTLATCIQRHGDFALINQAEFNAALREYGNRVAAGIAAVNK